MEISFENCTSRSAFLMRKTLLMGVIYVSQRIGCEILNPEHTWKSKFQLLLLEHIQASERYHSFLGHPVDFSAKVFGNILKNQPIWYVHSSPKYFLFRILAFEYYCIFIRVLLCRNFPFLNLARFVLQRF